MGLRDIVAIALILSFPFASGAADPIKVVTEEFPPLQYSEDGELTGPSTEIVRAVFARAGLDAQISVLPWARAYKLATTEPDVVIFSIGRTKEREAKFRWVGTIAERPRAFFYTARTDISVSGMEDVKSYLVGSSLNDVLLEYLQRNGFQEGKNLIELRNYEIGYRMLKARRIDFLAVSEDLMNYFLRQDPEGSSLVKAALPVEGLDPRIGDSGGDYMATSLATSDQLYGKLRSALEAMKADGTYRAIIDRYRRTP